MPFTQTERLHYSRHFNLPEIGINGQQRLKAARVLCIGAGGLGSSTLLYLAAAGIGTIGIIDDDCVEASNLQRQVLYSYDDIGEKKVIAAQKRLQRLNPSIAITTHPLRLTQENALELLAQFDVIADGSDNFATRYLVNDACFRLKKPLVYASISQFDGQCSIFNVNDGVCYRCVFDSPPPPHLIPNCAEGGVLGVLPGVLGSIQATEVLKIILGIGKPLINRLLMYNALTMTFQELDITKNPDCRLCNHQETLPIQDTCNIDSSTKNEITVEELRELQTTNKEFILLDVREPFEYDICHLNGILIPLKSLPQHIFKLDKNKHIIVYCKHGIRSRYAADYLQQHDFNTVSNLTGGIIEWIDKIDPTMQKY